MLGVRDPSDPVARGGYLKLSREALAALPAALEAHLQCREAK